jgi:hypothetical protein
MARQNQHVPGMLLPQADHPGSDLNGMARAVSTHRLLAGAILISLLAINLVVWSN